MADGITRDDLRAAVASGVLDEAQASKLMILSDQRQGFRANMIGDDEPFELFKGFAEIFVTVGLTLLISGLLGLSALLGEFIVVPVAALALSWLLALYFTQKRRMSLPSIALCISFAISLSLLVAMFLYDDLIAQAQPHKTMIIGVAGMLGMAAYYAKFRLPFAMFALGIFGIVLMTGMVEALSGRSLAYNSLTDFFDLRTEPYLAIGTLIFGICAFAAALWFDLQDPHRVSRKSASAFWLHILAAPALVNTLVMSNYQMGGPVGTGLAILVLAIFALLAVIIDRRSFLTAGLVYIGLLLAAAMSGTGSESSPILTMLVLGVFVTSLGAFWTQVRAWLLGALPDFPGKQRLPPYQEGLAVTE